MLESVWECVDVCIFVYVCVEREESADKQADIHTEAETESEAEAEAVRQAERQRQRQWQRRGNLKEAVGHVWHFGVEVCHFYKQIEEVLMLQLAQLNLHRMLYLVLWHALLGHMNKCSCHNATAQAAP